MTEHLDKNVNGLGNSLEKVNFGDLPIGQNEDVEFSQELADEADIKAQKRAAEADRRVKNGE
ncbi:YfhD family protein [Paenibacillus sp. MY03]|uniref:YfhD family protein n=1 Tax=Paenibacillus TaxID=44249 RepID=UPI000B3D0890|nr:MULTISPECIES: YfhD family protein [Paenibacillus]OUS77540.1 YfhD family protein [Paenibacillus sp. MY03]